MTWEPKRLQRELAKAGNSGYLPKTNPNCANRHTRQSIGAETARCGEFGTITRLTFRGTQASARGVRPRQAPWANGTLCSEWTRAPSPGSSCHITRAPGGPQATSSPRRVRPRCPRDSPSRWDPGRSQPPPPPAALHASPRPGRGRTGAGANRSGGSLVRPTPGAAGAGDAEPRLEPAVPGSPPAQPPVPAVPEAAGCPPGRRRAGPHAEALTDLERCFRICFLMSPAMVPGREAPRALSVPHCLLSSWPSPLCPG